jgi:translation initiation factor 6
VAGTKIVGRLLAGNKNGLLVPTTTSDNELMYFRNCLPENIKI